MAPGGLMLGLKFFVDAARTLLPPDEGSALELASLVLALGGVLFIVPVFVWRLRHLSARERLTYFSRESSSASVSVRAQTGSWNVTLLVLIGLAVLTDRSATMPIEVVVAGLLGVAFTIFSTVFLVLNREHPGAATMDEFTLRNRVRVFRAEHRMTQSDLGEAIGVSRKTVSTIQVGRFTPSTVMALVMARHFDVPVEKVFWLEDADP